MTRVALVAAGAEGEAAERLLAQLPDLELGRHEAVEAVPLDRTDVLWLHDVEARPRAGLLPWIESGGRLLLTLQAALLPARLGLERRAPDEILQGTWRHEEGEIRPGSGRSPAEVPCRRGFAAFGPHPLFAGLDQGACTWAPREGERYRWVAYRGAWPADGWVVAVERSFLHLDPRRAVAWEYAVGAGGVLCIGAFFLLAAPDTSFTPHLRALLANAILGTGIPDRRRSRPVTHWPPRRGEPAASSPPPAPPPVPDLPGSADPWPVAAAPFSIRSGAEADDPWTLAGRRALLVGGERSGLLEAWFHPFRAMRAVRCEIGGRAPGPVWVDLAPDRVERVLEVGALTAAERWTTALEVPLLVWELEAGEGTPIALEWITDLRRTWPYPAGAGGPLRWRLGETGAGMPDNSRLWVGATDLGAELLVQLAGGAVGAVTPLDTEDAPALRIRVEGEGRLRVIVAAGVEEGDLARTLRRAARQGLPGLAAERSAHGDRIRTHLVSIEAPPAELERAFEWAKVRLDSSLAEVPGMGRSLVAGYAASGPGRGEGDGRPGHASFFGRDACWTAFATLAMGDRDAARDVLRFLCRTQDVTGEVLHEYTTSGFARYGAAQSTPLALLLAGRYAAWTGDLEYLERYWPALLRAYRFVLETDRDGDGLIEPHRADDARLVPGPPRSGAVTLELVACWVAALEALEPVARALGEAPLAEELAARAARARAAAEQLVTAGEEDASDLAADGAPRRHRTARLAVPILLGLVPPERAAAWYDDIASERFSAPWGVRLVARDDPRFDPADHRRGAVWPLCTGWVSLAEWRGARCEAALAHLMANARLAFERAKGAFDEALHGLERRAAGLCPDQACSAAMVVSPAVEGLFGVVPDALHGAVSLSPHLPATWKDAALRRLRVGGTLLDLRLRRRGETVMLLLEKRAGPRIRVTASLRGAPAVQGVTINEEPVGSARVAFELDGTAEVRYTLSGSG